MQNADTRKRLWAVTLPAMLLPFFSAILYFDYLSDQPIAKPLYGATKIFTLLWPMIGMYLIDRIWFPKITLSDSRHKAAIPLGVVTGLGVSCTILLSLVTPIGKIAFSAAPAIQAKAQELGFIDWFIPFALFLSLLHSLLEEYYWRWFVYGNLRLLLSPALASVIAAAAFASHHVIVLNQYFAFSSAVFFGAAVMMGGLLWNYLYEKQGTLVGAWISHMLVDLTIMTIGYFLLF